MCVDKNVASPKLYVLEPWIADLLVNYEHLDERENFLAGQVVRVGTQRDCPKVVQKSLKSKFWKVCSGSQFGGCGCATLNISDFNFFLWRKSLES